MDQASGGEDPNKPSKKKSGEDDGKNKKLVSITHPCFSVACSLHNYLWLCMLYN